jgi:hypothetical protein
LGDKRKSPNPQIPAILNVERIFVGIRTVWAILLPAL